MTAFDEDLEALAWARSKVQGYLDRLTEFEARARAEGDAMAAIACQAARVMAERHFLGDGDDVIGIFDERIAEHIRRFGRL
ncbi:hypothetical protein [Streptomyces sp. NPDC086989]|uniref:hypothetical protein n=1 Tax=Streptomyces sp. NPDC086989 TaxID=3365764 RepID=UPI0038181F4D